MNDKLALKITNVSKTFILPNEKNQSIKSAVVGFWHRDKGYERQEVLKDISFEVKKGEFFGIVGRNGSGKSTLLKAIAGIYSLDKGTIERNGNLTPFIELGVGFNQELTGRENVFLNGALLGFSRKEMGEMYPGIVDFSELHRFMDQKLKNYSSGMQVRLAFAISIKSQSEILLFDEVLAVGDSEFQTKCFNYFREIKKSDRTVVLVTHDMSAVQKFCDRAMVIHEGDMEYIGSPNEAAFIYQKINFPDASQTDTKETKEHGHKKFEITVLNAETKKPSRSFKQGQKACIKLSWHKDDAKKVKHAGVSIFTSDGSSYVFGTNTFLDNVKIDQNDTHIDYTIDLNLGTGSYSVRAALFGEDEDDVVFFDDNGPIFTVNNDRAWQGLTSLKHDWGN